MRSIRTFYYVTLILYLGFLNQSTVHAQVPQVHAHRGGAGEYPENTIEAMLHAVSQGVRVLELDVHITADSLVVVSHDPFIHPSKALRPDGTRIACGTALRQVLFQMSYDKISTYDIGSLAQAKYPQRVNINCRIPLLSDLISNVEVYTKKHQLAAVTYNIEIKSHPFKDNRWSPDYQTFVRLVMDVLRPRNLGSRLIIQSFDTRVLNYLHANYPNLQLSYLVKSRWASLDKLLGKLYFTPSIISPHYKMVNQGFVNQAHSLGMKVVPWTVDRKAEVIRLRDCAVDGIITNYPSQVLDWVEE